MGGVGRRAEVDRLGQGGVLRAAVRPTLRKTMPLLSEFRAAG